MQCLLPNTLSEFSTKKAPFLKRLRFKRAPNNELPSAKRGTEGSNPTSYPKTAFGIYGNFNKKSGSKNPEMVDATGIFPVASIPFGFCGAPAGIRTPDTLLKRQVLCLLSYWGGYKLLRNGRRNQLAGMAGLEPTISESKSGVLPLHYIPV